MSTGNLCANVQVKMWTTSYVFRWQLACVVRWEDGLNCNVDADHTDKGSLQSDMLKKEEK